MKKIILSLLLCVSLNAFAAELHRLVKSGKVDQVREYLKAHPEHVDHPNDIKRTPLHCAAIRGRVNVVRLLIDCGADVNLQDSSKETPLQYAAFYGRVDVVRLLIDHGANFNNQDSQKRTPLFWAASRGFIYVIQLLIDFRANVNQVDHFGRTPLFVAAENSHLECVRLLLESGANIPFTVDQSEAVRKMNVPEIIQLLEGKNILTGGFLKKQLKPCLRQYGNSCMIHALKNAGLLTEYYAADVEQRKEIDRKFMSQHVYNECLQSELFSELRKITKEKSSLSELTMAGMSIAQEVIKISESIDQNINIILYSYDFSLPKRDFSRKSEILLVLNRAHWYVVGMEEQPDGSVEISVLDSDIHLDLGENFYRKLTHWFKSGSIKQPATEHLRSRLYRKLTHWFKGGSIEQPATEQLRSRL